MTSYFGQQIAAAAIAAALAVIVSWLVWFILNNIYGSKEATRWMWLVLIIGSIVVIGIFTVAPIGIRAHYDRALILVPFSGGEYSNVSSRLIFGKIAYNIALFVPLGFCLRMAIFRNTWLPALVGFGVSMIVEALQYATARGTTTTSDVLLNTIGAFLGAVLADGLMRLLIRRRVQRSKTPAGAS